MAESNALAQQLIDTVRRELDAEATLVRGRVAYTLEYISQVREPNRITLVHIESMLTGGYDPLIAEQARTKTKKES